MKSTFTTVKEGLKEHSKRFSVWLTGGVCGLNGFLLAGWGGALLGFVLGFCLLSIILLYANMRHEIRPLARGSYIKDMDDTLFLAAVASISDSERRRNH